MHLKNSRLSDTHRAMLWILALCWGVTHSAIADHDGCGLLSPGLTFQAAEGGIPIASSETTYDPFVGPAVVRSNADAYLLFWVAESRQQLLARKLSLEASSGGTGHWQPAVIVDEVFGTDALSHRIFSFPNGSGGAVLLYSIYDSVDWWLRTVELGADGSISSAPQDVMPGETGFESGKPWAWYAYPPERRVSDAVSDGRGGIIFLAPVGSGQCSPAKTTAALGTHRLFYLSPDKQLLSGPVETSCYPDAWDIAVTASVENLAFVAYRNANSPTNATRIERWKVVPGVDQLAPTWSTSISNTFGANYDLPDELILSPARDGGVYVLERRVDEYYPDPENPEARFFRAEIELTKIDASGVPSWPVPLKLASGVNALPANSFESDLFQMIPDGYGGVIAAWGGDNSGSTMDAAAVEKVTATGVRVWGSVSTPHLLGASKSSMEIRLVPDMMGGVEATWYRWAGEWWLRADRVSCVGQDAWSTAFPWELTKTAFTPGLRQPSFLSHATISNGKGGLVATWLNFPQSSSVDIHANQLLPASEQHYSTAVLSSQVPPGHVPLLCPAGDAEVITVELDLSSYAPGLTIPWFNLTLEDRLPGAARIFEATHAESGINFPPDYQFTTTFELNEGGGSGFCEASVYAPQPQGTLTLIWKSPDMNADGAVDGLDVSILSGSYNKSAGTPGFDWRADFNSDGAVNLVDLSRFYIHNGHSVGSPSSLGRRDPETVWEQSKHIWAPRGVTRSEFIESLAEVAEMPPGASSSPTHSPVVVEASSKHGVWLPLANTSAIESQLVDIYDIRGRKIRSIESSVGKPWKVWWNGTDDRGRPVGAGLYLYRVGQSGRVVRGKVLLLK